MSKQYTKKEIRKVLKKNSSSALFKVTVNTLLLSLTMVIMSVTLYAIDPNDDDPLNIISLIFFFICALGCIRSLLLEHRKDLLYPFDLMFKEVEEVEGIPIKWILDSYRQRYSRGKTLPHADNLVYIYHCRSANREEFTVRLPKYAYNHEKFDVIIDRTKEVHNFKDPQDKNPNGVLENQNYKVKFAVLKYSKFVIEVLDVTPVR